MALTYKKAQIHGKVYAHQKAWLDRMILEGEFGSYSHAFRVLIDFYKTKMGKGYYTFKELPAGREGISRR